MAAPMCNVLLLFFLTSLRFYCSAKPPNIVFVLTDDQDVVLGGETPMKKTTELVGKQGIIFKNMFVSSPLCCPSRSSILTGKFVHNHAAINNSISGNCSSTTWQQQEETKAFPVYLKQQQYTTFFAGKYLNQYGFKPVGGVEHVPPGWDWWNGLVGNSRYYNYQLSVNGTMEKHGGIYSEDYLTDLIHRRAMDFLQLQNKDKPFFMMLSTPSCHAPFTPAPQYSTNFSMDSAPRGGSFNMHATDKHWLIQQAKTPIPEPMINTIDGYFRNRWRTLLSVEDMVEDVVMTLDKRGLLDNTYVFFSSDNGYHLGQFSMTYDKRQLYEFDIRVPLMVRGPGIKPGQIRMESIMNIDLGPTFIDLSGGKVPDFMDGLSMTPIFNSAPTEKPVYRNKFLVEHTGEYEEHVPGCPQYENQGLFNCDEFCTCDDSWNNTFSCVIEQSDSHHLKYCRMADNLNFTEVYDLHSDPLELMNIAKSADPEIVERLSRELDAMVECSGTGCQKLQLAHWG